jgi:hypothetical protein
MALQINQEIETLNKGTVINPYIRIEAYRIDKMLGVLIAVAAMYQTKEEASSNSFVYSEDFLDPLNRQAQSGPISPSIIFNDQSIEYPVVNEFPLTVPEEITQDVYQKVEGTRTVTYNDFDEDGNIIEKTREETYSERVKTGTETVTKSKIDISVIGEDPYGWAYGKLKIALEGIFGAGNVIDC